MTQLFLAANRMSWLGRAALVAAVCCLVPSGPASAQDAPQWPTSCRGLSADPGQLVCTISQDVLNAEGELLFRIAIQRQAWRGETLIQIRTPLALHLPRGVGFGVDGQILKELGYEICTQAGCDVFAVLTKEDVAAILAGNEVDISFWRDAETRQSINIPLVNFDEGWAGITGSKEN